MAEEEEVIQEGQDYPHRRRRGDSGVPDWAKLAVSVAAAVVSVVLWANANFISRVEMNQHLEQQSKDFQRVAVTQEHYSMAERETAKQLSEVNSRLTRIETLLSQPRK